jgi:hypothetical protein
MALETVAEPIFGSGSVSEKRVNQALTAFNAGFLLLSIAIKSVRFSVDDLSEQLNNAIPQRLGAVEPLNLSA